MVPRSLKKQTWWNKGRLIVAALGLSAATVVSGFSYLGRFAEQEMLRPYVQDICDRRFDSLIAPYNATQCAITYDTKLTRLIIEDWATNEVVLRAKKKMDDTTWKVK